MIVRNNITEVAYNVQTTVDTKHNIPIDYKVTNQNDTRAMSGMLCRAKIILETNNFTALYDKGYHTGYEIKKAIELEVEILVAIPGVASFAPDDNYNFAHFKYDEKAHTYTCPKQQLLSTNGVWYQKKTDRNTYLVRHYKTNACASCPAMALCTKTKRGRLIERSEFTPYIEINRQNIEANPDLYKKRQAIVEHPYGTIKRQWGFYYVITKKGIKRAAADVGFMFTAYNLRRLINIIDRNTLVKFLKELGLARFFTKALVKRILFKIRLVVFNQYFTRTSINKRRIASIRFIFEAI